MHFQTLGALAFASSALAATHMVEVGKGGLKFDPPVTKAKKGDTVMFMFPSSIPHDVIMGNEDKPCEPEKGGFFSTELTKSDKMAFELMINSTEEIYFYCSVPTHCQAGMVGGINIEMDDYEDFEKAAMKTSSSGGPSLSSKMPIGGKLVSASSMSGGGSGGMGGGSGGGGGGAASSISVAPAAAVGALIVALGVFGL